MAALRSEPAAVAGGERVVARAFGGVVLMNSARPGPASHDGAGVRFVFVSAPGDPRRYAIDVERRDTPIPAPVARVLGAGDGDAAGRAWTALEVAAKLTGRPVHLLLLDEENQPQVQHVKIVCLVTEDHQIAIGRLQTEMRTERA